MQELNIYRGVMCNDNGQWWNIWREIDLSFQNWHKEFDEFGLEQSKVSETYTLMWCSWPRHIIFGLKKYRGVIFMTLDSDSKSEENGLVVLGK